MAEIYIKLKILPPQTEKSIYALSVVSQHRLPPTSPHLISSHPFRIRIPTRGVHILEELTGGITFVRAGRESENYSGNQKLTLWHKRCS